MSSLESDGLDLAWLVKQLEKPELHQKILGSRREGYALGVTRIDDELGLHLSIEGTVDGIPDQIGIDGRIIRIKVEGDWKVPRILPLLVETKEKQDE